jgi:hypothetical protein
LLHPHTLLWTLLFAACNGSNDSDVPEALPDTDTTDSLPSDSIDWSIEDTGLNGGYSNEEPPFELDLAHAGVWELLPLGGPYTSMVGEMTVTELLDGNENTPWCSATFSLTGQATPDLCDTCDYGFIILFYLTKEGSKDKNKDDDEKVGGLEDCRSPDLPADGETRTLAYSDADSTIYFNYYGSDIWIPWYDASDLHDEVNFEWESTLGFIGKEEDE